MPHRKSKRATTYLQHSFCSWHPHNDALSTFSGTLRYESHQKLQCAMLCMILDEDYNDLFQPLYCNLLFCSGLNVHEH